MALVISCLNSCASRHSPSWISAKCSWGVQVTCQQTGATLGDSAKGAWSGVLLRCSPGLWLSIGIQVVLAVYSDFHSHNHRETQGIIFYLHLHRGNLGHRETFLSMKCWGSQHENSPRAHGGAARLLLIPEVAAVNLCEFDVCGVDVCAVT